MEKKKDKKKSSIHLSQQIHFIRERFNIQLEIQNRKKIKFCTEVQDTSCGNLDQVDKCGSANMDDIICSAVENNAHSICTGEKNI
ncbi:---NA--- [Octopus vulgaris]|uniref:---NA n=1 Tax=Octopus vulgaris TaxID=6645 RepID=A0AA36FJK8_OCTVU|nr:---NA--- [Octopus vulgaris]